jgi:hypothetical protein
MSIDSKNSDTPQVLDIDIGDVLTNIRIRISKYCILWSKDALLGNDSINTSRGNEYATIEDIRC